MTKGTYLAKSKMAYKSKQKNISENYKKVLKALVDEKYKYRTISGISNSTGLTMQKVQEELSTHGEEIVVLSRKNQRRERLYTTREHYKKTASLTEKAIGAFINGIY